MNIPLHPEDLKAFWIAFFVSALLSKPILNLLIKAKSRQTVSSHLEGHATKQGTPTMGGFIILVGMFAGGLLSNPNQSTKSLLGVGLLFALIGFVDDYVVPRLMPGKRGLGWKQKIVMQVLAAAVPMALLGAEVKMLALAAFIILFFANAYNFADGLDGLAGSILLGQIVGMIGIPAALGPEVFVSALLPLSMLGGLLVFLFWNAPKAKVFMGDVGALSIGAILGAYWLTVTYSPHFHDDELQTGTSITSLILSVLIWSIPMICELVPVPLQVFSVKVFKKKLFPFTPIHHAFEEIKLKPGETEESESYIERKRTSPRWAHWPETRIVFTFAIFQLLCSMLAITVAYFSVNK